jgi:hypothetical protein
MQIILEKCKHEETEAFKRIKNLEMHF